MCPSVNLSINILHIKVNVRKVALFCSLYFLYILRKKSVNCEIGKYHIRLISGRNCDFNIDFLELVELEEHLVLILGRSG